jgi:hypothetical protein
MADKKDHKAVRKALNAEATVGSTLNKLSEIAIETEDEKLKAALLVLSSNIRAQSAKTTEKVRLLGIKNPGAKPVADAALAIDKYCVQVLDSAEKEWEIMARRAGWRPPEA